MMKSKPKGTGRNKAAEFAQKDGMIVGLGTGVSCLLFCESWIGSSHQKEKKACRSQLSQRRVWPDQAESLGIPLKAIDDVEVVDVTVDGADEVDPQLRSRIKGGGGALLMEKNRRNQFKDCVDRGWIQTSCNSWCFQTSSGSSAIGAENLSVILRAGYHPAFRQADDQRFVTDQGNLSLTWISGDRGCRSSINELDHTVGVVEHGLFLNMISKVIVGTPDDCHHRKIESGTKSVIR